MKMHKILSACTAAALLATTVPAVTFAAQSDVSEAASESIRAVETFAAAAAAETLPYQDMSLSFEERAADLAARMTLEEKAAQTRAKGGNAVSRLGVKNYYYWREGIHGVARQGGATSFPSSLAMSNTWDRNLVFDIMDITSTEARGKNNRYDLNYWNPTINLARDPRWGRNEETYGEDPYLTGEIGGNAVKGMQGTDEKYWKTITTLKHYAANNCEGERQFGTSVMNERTMREYYTRAFRDISENFNPGAVMSSYNGTTVYNNGKILESSTGQKIDYVASSANSYLINDLLRRTYGFDGFVVGDCGAWDNAYGRAPLRKKLYPDTPLDDISAPMTVSKIIEAGSSLDCNSDANGTDQVINAVNEGLITEDELDIVVYELFLARMRTGEFDSGAKYQDITSAAIETEESNQKAEEAAEKTWVMLENKNNALPLASSVQKVAVVGGYANEVILGDYSAEMDKMKQAHLVKPIDGITSEIKKINPNAEVNLIGSVSESTPLFNMKSLKLIKGSKEEAVDLTKATTVLGAQKDGTGFKNMTSSATIIIPSVNFKDVTDISIEAASFTGMPNVTVQIGYGSASQNAANVKINPTADENTYAVNKDTYNGATGGYTDTKDMYITVSASTEFTVENYKDSLDAADVIIAYAGTTTADSSESNDRKSIDLPSSQGHVQKICDVYPDKTIVALQTVGQVNVEGFKDKCAAMLWTSYNGQQQGTALGKILTGAANPSGKLSTTWYTQADLNKMPIGSAKTKIDGIDYYFTNYELDKDINNPDADYPGRTYQYYTGTPVYPFGYGKSYTSFAYSNVKASKNAADANDVIQISADITNTGSKAGEEVVQLYIAAPGAGTNGLPIKQLKNFDKIKLDAGAKQTVTFDLDISDVYFYDEAKQQNYVIPGEYTAYVGASSADTANSVKFTVSGDIDESLKNVYVIPSGITLYIATDKTGAHPNEPGNYIDAGVSVALKNDKVVTDFASSGITVTYKSGNTDVATVDENGIVKAGTKTGVTTITVIAAKSGSESVTTTFPVVTETKERMSDDKKNAYLKQLDDAYSNCLQITYLSEDWAKLDGIYKTASEFVANAVLEDNVESTVNTAIAEIQAIPKIELEEKYTVVSVNPIDIQDGVIDYDPSGIGSYTAKETAISGTITESNPCVIDLKALENGNAADGSLLWYVERIDGSSRKDASIDLYSGKLTIYENGVYKILAANYPGKKGGTLIVNANLQIEGESADEANGAKLDDKKDGASGGLCAGSTAAQWLRFDGVKLDGLADITMRVSNKDAESKLKVSMTPSDNWIIAEATAPKTGAWTTWADVKMAVNDKVLDMLTLDDNGCTSIYVQTNAANLDYIRFAYNTGELEVTNADGGKMSVSTPANLTGSTLIGAVYNDDGTINKVATGQITGETTVLEGLEEHDKTTIYAWSGLDTIKPMAGKTTKVYNKAQEAKKTVMYNFSDPNFDSFFNTAENTLQRSNLGMDNYGGWGTGGGGSCTFNGVKYTFTRSLKGGASDTMARKVFFTPQFDGVVTAFFMASTNRVMNIEQDGNVLNTAPGTGDKNVATVQANVKAGVPVYVYGGGANKTLCGVLFEGGKTAEITTPSPSPSATPVTTLDPIPEDQILAKQTIQFENYAKALDSGFKAEDLADGNKCIGTTGDGYTFYFGEQSMDNLGEISLLSCQRDDGGNVTVTFYAVDMTGIDDAAIAKSLLTDTNKLGTVSIIGGKDWKTYYENRLRFTDSSKLSGKKGLFVKLNTDGRYAGNHDKITLTYLKPSASSASQELTAENDNTAVSISGDVITSVDKYTGEINTISYSKEYGSEVVFNKLVNTNGMLTAVVTDTESGKTRLITSPAGTVWMDITPTEFAESDLDNADYKINDVISVGGQTYLACDDGVLITMPPCAKCVTLKKVCDFDIKAFDYASGEDVITLVGESESTEISIIEARQSNIQKEASYELVNGGAQLVDVRSADEFASGSIDGAVNVPVDDFADWIASQPGESTIIVFCGSGARAEKAVEIAEAQGFTNIYSAGSIDNLR